MCLILQGTTPDGVQWTAFQCCCDPDDPEYLARLYPQEPYEDPQEVEQMFRRLMKADRQPRAKHISLVDLSTDRVAYTRKHR